MKFAKVLFVGRMKIIKEIVNYFQSGCSGE